MRSLPPANDMPEHLDPQGGSMLWTTPEVAAHLGLAEITLRKWRIAGTGPRFIRCGANVRYRLTDIENWIASRTVASTSEAA